MRRQAPKRRSRCRCRCQPEHMARSGSGAARQYPRKYEGVHAHALGPELVLNREHPHTLLGAPASTFAPATLKWTQCGYVRGSEMHRGGQAWPGWTTGRSTASWGTWRRRMWRFGGKGAALGAAEGSERAGGESTCSKRIIQSSKYPPEGNMAFMFA